MTRGRENSMRRYRTWEERCWTGVVSTLARMGRILRAKREDSAAPAQQRHPLLDLVLGDAGIVSAIGEVVASDIEQRGVLSWASVTLGPGGATIRLNHKGPLAHLQQAQEALAGALRKVGRRAGFRDFIRHPNQNGYVLLLRVPDPAPALGFAR
jgi:hypothetical protein